jgi:hypothetical protein
MVLLFETEQPQEPDPRPSHSEEDKDQATWPLRGECESETNNLSASQIAHPSKRVKGWEPEGCRTRSWVTPSSWVPARQVLGDGLGNREHWYFPPMLGLR